jgi:predicted TIM-barrel fold metal-dependent hydrolase
MNEEIKKRIQFQMQYLTENQNRLTIDADTHISNFANFPAPLLEAAIQPDYYQGKPISAEDLLCEMKMARVDMSLIWQNPAATVYYNNPEKDFQSLLEANQYIFDTVQKYPDRFLGTGWTDPKALGIEGAKKLASVFVKEFGFPVVKLNPAQNAFPIDSNQVIEVTEHIISLGAIPAFHYGGDTPYTPPSGLARLANRFPETPIIAVHMGGGGSAYVEGEYHYLETRKIGLEHPNLKFILSARRDTHSESDLITFQASGEPFSNNICCASDAPYGRQTWNFGGYRLMFESLKNGAEHTDIRLQQNPGLFTDEAISGYMGGNITRIYLKAYQLMLKI